MNTLKYIALLSIMSAGMATIATGSDINNEDPLTNEVKATNQALTKEFLDLKSSLSLPALKGNDLGSLMDYQEELQNLLTQAKAKSNSSSSLAAEEEKKVSSYERKQSKFKNEYHLFPGEVGRTLPHHQLKNMRKGETVAIDTYKWLEKLNLTKDYSNYTDAQIIQERDLGSFQRGHWSTSTVQAVINNANKKQ
jgi:hypothetical protein